VDPAPTVHADGDNEPDEGGGNGWLDVMLPLASRVTMDAGCPVGARLDSNRLFVTGAEATTFP
jgi:hypothetical protein